MMRPMPNVSVAATAPSASWRPPLTNALRPVNRDSAAPTANSAAALRPALATTKGVPALAPKKNGTTGTTAPAANARNEPMVAPQGEPSSEGSRPSSSRTSVSRATSGFSIRRAATDSACSRVRPFAR